MTLAIITFQTFPVISFGAMCYACGYVIGEVLVDCLKKKGIL